ncbi:MULTISPECIES: lysylphosphatidylglycerol synthase transmembrane domain-containing protein [unclassified Stenotrophomonas]|uniref:lysylphosphatidylglycerol synthase transmembrane domain-containing protein n=1 Tax=unclassified Stenotrophomonas TaxID=196198 RepID=UPI001F358E99|nr:MULTISPECIES: lysylphosphatidylglycerol synthase transmembrane domain-containing protein [unclassified Stenotrophomonas]
MRLLPPHDGFSPPRPPRWRGVFLLSLVTAGYLAVLGYVDRDTQALERLTALGGPLLACAALVLVSFALRYQRWHGALRRQGHSVARWRGLRAYLAGFAFTASPGKAGELLRIRYFADMGVPPRAVLGTFIHERSQDLLILTVLGLSAATLVPALGAVLAVVLALLMLVIVTSCSRWLQTRLMGLTRVIPGAPLKRLLTFLVEGLITAGPLWKPNAALPGLAWGTLAWLVTAVAFAMLCAAVGLDLDWHQALGIYPIAMLAGAVSFIPGGVGTTEAAIVLMLTRTGASLEAALAVAVGIRLTSLWLAVVVGMLAMTNLELQSTRSQLSSSRPS